jgi:acetyl esterase/lipase
MKRGSNAMFRKAVFLGLLLSSGAALADNKTAAEAFGQREGIENISLSPDGTKISYIAPAAGQGSTIYTVDLANDGARKAVMSASGDPERLTGCDWISNMRLVCRIYSVSEQSGVRFNSSRIVAVNIDGSNPQMLSKRQGSNAVRYSFFGGEVIDLLPGDDNAVLMGREYVPQNATGSNLKKDEDGYGVDRVDTVKGSFKRVVKANNLATDYISDGAGNVRIMSLMVQDNDFDSGRRRFLFRPAEGGGWKLLSEYDRSDDSGFYPVAVDPTENVAYGFEELNGRDALYKVTLDAALTKTLVYKRDDVDVDDLLQMGRQKKIVGLSFATKKRQAVYFDPELGKLATSLQKALPDAAMISFGGMSADGSKVIVGAYSDINPGQLYLFDKTAGNVRPLFAVRPELEGIKLAQVKPVAVKAADGTAVPAYLTLPPGSNGKGLPAIVMPHGGPGARDEWGFDWLAQFYANRGFAVLQPNYRGSAGYGDSWYQINGFQSWKTAIGDVNDSGRWLVSEGIADPAKLAIVGWSYGGYAALQSAVVDPDLFKAIVAIAPVTDLGKLKDESLGNTSYRVVKDFIGSGPHIAEGSPARHADAFKAPVALFHGDLDLNVLVYQSRNMAEELKEAGKEVELTIYPKLDHQLEDSAARADMLGKSDAFLRKALGLPPAP